MLYTTQDAISHASMLALGNGTSSALIMAGTAKRACIEQHENPHNARTKAHAAHLWDFYADIEMALMGLAPDNLAPTLYSSKWDDFDAPAMEGPDCEGPLTPAQEADYRAALRRLAEGR